jgi:hypothetical protein
VDNPRYTIELDGVRYRAVLADGHSSEPCAGCAGDAGGPCNDLPLCEDMEASIGLIFVREDS